MYELASHTDVLRGSARVPAAGTRDEPLRTSGWEAMYEMEKRSDDVAKSKFVKLYDWLAYPVRKDENCSLAKNQPVGANW